MKQQRSPTLLQLWFWLVTRLMGWLIMGCLSSILLSIIIVVLRGEYGFTLLNQLVKSDYHYITSNVIPGSVLWIKHGVQAVPESVIQPAIQLPIVSSRDQQKLWLQGLPLIRAILIGIQLLVIRCYLLLHWCSLFLVLGMVGFIDGLVQRYIRRVVAGRESALIYHNAKPLISLSLILGIFICLVAPLSVIHTEWLVILSAMAFGLAVQITTKRFKKYL